MHEITKILTAQIWGSPVHRLPTSMSTLSRVFSKGITEAGKGVTLVTEAQVLYTRLYVGIHLNQIIAAREFIAHQYFSANILSEKEKGKGSTDRLCNFKTDF